MAKKLVEKMTEPWKPEQYPEEYHDTYHDDLMKLIDKRIKAGETEVITEVWTDDDDEKPARGEVIDLHGAVKAKRPGEGTVAFQIKSGLEKTGAASSPEECIADLWCVVCFLERRRAFAVACVNKHQWGFSKGFIGRKVRIEPGAHITDSVIFDNTRIGAKAHLTRVIVDRHNKIPAGTELGEAESISLLLHLLHPRTLRSYPNRLPRKNSPIALPSEGTICFRQDLNE